MVWSLWVRGFYLGSLVGFVMDRFIQHLYAAGRGVGGRVSGKRNASGRGYAHRFYSTLSANNGRHGLFVVTPLVVVAGSQMELRYAEMACIRSYMPKWNTVGVRRRVKGDFGWRFKSDCMDREVTGGVGGDGALRRLERLASGRRGVSICSDKLSKFFAVRRRITVAMVSRGGTAFSRAACLSAVGGFGGGGGSLPTGNGGGRGTISVPMNTAIFVFRSLLLSLLSKKRMSDNQLRALSICENDLLSICSLFPVRGVLGAGRAVFNTNVDRLYELKGWSIKKIKDTRSKTFRLPLVDFPPFSRFYWYVINLESASDRWSEFKNREVDGRLAGQGFNFTRVRAADPIDVSSRTYLPSQDSPYLFRLLWPDREFTHPAKNPMTLPEYGCTFSHLVAIWTAYNNGDEVAIMAEDDASFENLMILAKARRQSPKDTVLSLFESANRDAQSRAQASNTPLSVDPDPLNGSPLLFQLFCSSREHDVRAWNMLENGLAADLEGDGSSVLCPTDLPMEQMATFSRRPASEWAWGTVAYVLNRKAMALLLDRFSYPAGEANSASQSALSSWSSSSSASGGAFGPSYVEKLGVGAGVGGEESERETTLSRGASRGPSEDWEREIERETEGDRALLFMETGTEKTEEGVSVDMVSERYPVSLQEPQDWSYCGLPEDRISFLKDLPPLKNPKAALRVIPYMKFQTDSNNEKDRVHVAEWTQHGGGRPGGPQGGEALSQKAKTKQIREHHQQHDRHRHHDHAKKRHSHHHHHHHQHQHPKKTSDKNKNKDKPQAADSEFARLNEHVHQGLESLFSEVSGWYRGEVKDPTAPLRAQPAASGVSLLASSSEVEKRRREWEARKEQRESRGMSSREVVIDLGCYKHVQFGRLQADALLYDSIVGDGGECFTLMVPLVNSQDSTSMIHKELDERHSQIYRSADILAGIYLREMEEIQALKDNMPKVTILEKEKKGAQPASS
uniref:Glycosyl transferase family 25 domain-containing protein n=1 Tax=Chromera velia CCMP2878 TaxID=1169474 RepID=A0A0G4G9G4_9ALVE|eukprot:Cvel_4387.t1-p1 / transcript=Cvel_4387.t1 / gene=Cvel_4387 / organism=Chromera_velia_CCMP2878 / gene_product=hypothetical protein / transcript_product=hypothetical protein / location=Cvel_scaffold190:58343-71207(+) / protein_length=963 / sequence_SO=supercontig / SO=protein_coding / is_pseudo=false